MSEKSGSAGLDVADLAETFGLSPREARFVVEMAKDNNASAAYVRAGYAKKHANANVARLTAKNSIQAALSHVRAKVAASVEFEAAEVLQLAGDILRADPRELVSYVRGCCRYCHGKGGLYQRTEGEMAQDRAKHEAQVARRQERNKDYQDPGFNEQGGDGFNAGLDPNPECPDCGGEGIGRVVIADTRHLSREAAALYAGVKKTKDGTEVLMHDKAAMVDKMFRYHGLYESDNKQTATQAADPAALIALSEAMERSREKYAALIEKRRQEGFTGD